MSAESVSASTTYRRLLGYSARYWPIAIVAVIGMVFDAGCGAMFTFLIKPMLDELFDRHDPVMIFWMPIIIIVLFVVRGVATFSADYGVARIGRGVVQTMREEVFAKYLRMPASFFHREAAGSLISRMTYTVEQVANASTDALKIALMDGFMVVGQACVMLYWSPRLTLVLLLLAPLVAIVVFTVGRRYRRISKTIQESVGSITGIIDEAVTGHREVKIYGGQPYEQTRFNAVNAAIRRLNMKVSTTNAFSTAMIQIVASVALALVIFLATRPGIHEMTSGIFMSVITAMLVMLPSLKRLTTVQANLQRGVVAARDVFELIDSSDERDTGNEKLERCNGDVEFRDVSFRYPGTSTIVLEGITLRCAPGTVTALVGRSGSGKSSLAGLLPRFYDPESGSISLDGHPLSTYSLASLRAQIALVSQQVVLFNDTIARNIAYGSLGRAGEAEIAAAAEAANAMEFVKRMPNGMQSRIGDAGALLSGGQRQRIAIARAILKDAPILILDEATSALDSESERLIQDALKNLLSNRTVLVIAHRLSTIEHADQIVVLDEGRIVEIGKHAELLARNGQYALLHRMQFRDTGG
ncbi:MAG TPA: lipid A export permease/ATP-binding protein MsbA [Rudaea sp.]|nr:lipid A export permease/ATP-binding protein MsbA [Rudaea sp.]